MNLFKTMFALPPKLRPRMLVAFCLNSLIPILVGVYVGSLFIKYPFDANPLSLFVISVVILLTILLSILGHEITEEFLRPFLNVTRSAKNIAEGNFIGEPVYEGVDELEDLSKSLKTISQNAQELLEKVEKLSLKDKLTGLYKVSYMRERLSEEIQRSVHYQRPCSFVYFHIQSLMNYTTVKGQTASEELLKGVAQKLGKYLSEFDRAARLSHDEFAIIFADKNKKGAIEIIEKICGEINVFLLPYMDFNSKTPLKIFAGISENPLDGVLGDELYSKAQSRMKLAMTQGGREVEAFA